MVKGSKLAYIIGSMAIGVIALIVTMSVLIFSGLIDVTQTKIAFKSASNEFLYDGESHADTSWDIVSGQLKEGHTANVVVSGEQTEVGESTNFITVTIVDENGQDVTSHYDIDYQPGTLKVHPTSLMIESASRTKVYDGLPMTGDEYRYDGSLPSGYVIDVEFSKYITHVGTMSNAFTAKIYDENGFDKTSSYALTYVFGNLEVVQREIIVQSSDANKVYDGMALSSDTFVVTQGSIVDTHVVTALFGDDIVNVGEKKNNFVLSITDENGIDVSSNYYVQYLYGTLAVTPRPITITTSSAEKVYDAQPLIKDEYSIDMGSVPEYQTLIVNVVGEQTAAGSVVNTAQIEILDEYNQSVIDNYDITLIEGVLTVLPRPITISTGGEEKVYDGVDLSNDNYTINEGEIVDNQTLIVDIKGIQRDVGLSNNIADVDVIDANGDSVKDNYDITLKEGKLSVLVRVVTIKTASDSKIYDSYALTNDNYTIVGGSIAENQSINVLLSGTQTVVGKSKNTLADKDYDIFDSELRSVKHNYDLIIIEGELEVLPRPLTFSTGSSTKEYDATVLTNEEYTLTEGTLADTHVLYVQNSGEQLDVGIGKNELVLDIKDADEVSVLSNYSITVEEGTLEVTPRLITIESSSAQKVYDGLPLTENTCFVVSGSVAEGHTLITSVKGKQTEVGESDNYLIVDVIDNSGTTMLDNYSITVEEGVLTVTKRVLVIQTGSAEKVYDGTTLRNGEYSIISGTVAEGQTISIEAVGSQTEVGESNNVLNIDIISDGYSQLDNYEVITLEGKLKVTPIKISITSPSGQKEYDGQPYTLKEWSVTPDNALLQGHEMTVAVVGTITEVGSKPNTITEVVIIDENDKDVSANYEVEKIQGTLTIIPRAISITTNNASKVYDGQPLTCDEWEQTSGTLADGHTIKVTVAGNIIDVGSTPNSIANVTILDAQSHNVTLNYNIEKVTGTLTVNPCTLTIRSGDASKVYDGQPLTHDEWIISSSSQLVEGHTVEVTVSGTRTEVGESDNTIAEVKVLDAQGVDVTYNYNVSTELGVLVVKGTNTGGDSGEGGGGDGGEGGGPPSGENIGGGVPSQDTVQVRIFADKSGQVYLRYVNYGDYTGSGWEDAVAYSGLMDDMYSMNYLTSFALQESGASERMIRIDVVSGSYYLVPYYASTTIGHLQTSDVISSGDASSIYDLKYYAYDYRTSGAIAGSSAYSVEEQAYYDWVASKYLQIPTATADYLATIIAQEGWSATDSDIVNKVATYIQGAAVYSLEYADKLIDGVSLDECEDKVISFLRDYKTGICQHYASAGTMMFRQLGLPARYVAGYVANATAGEWVDVPASQAHAWVEVYIKGLGWVQVEVTGGGPGGGGGNGDGNGSEGEDGEGGSGDQNNDVFIVRPYSVYCKYDGQEHDYSCYTLQGLQGLSKLPTGYTYTYSVEGSRTELGFATTTITSFAILDENGNDVTSNYQIELRTGKLQVYEYKVSIGTLSGSKTYDGTPLSVKQYNVTSSNLPSNYNLIVEVDGSNTNVGTKLNTCKVTVLDENGQDVTHTCKINTDLGELKITPIDITITADSAQKVYDSTALTCDGYTLSGTLANGHTIESVEVIGTQTYVGYSDNMVGIVVIKDANGIDVTANYNITKVNGTLKVTRF